MYSRVLLNVLLIVAPLYVQQVVSFLRSSVRTAGFRGILFKRPLVCFVSSCMPHAPSSTMPHHAWASTCMHVCICMWNVRASSCLSSCLVCLVSHVHAASGVMPRQASRPPTVGHTPQVPVEYTISAPATTHPDETHAYLGVKISVWVLPMSRCFFRIIATDPSSQVSSRRATVTKRYPKFG